MLEGLGVACWQSLQDWIASDASLIAFDWLSNAGIETVVHGF